MSTSTADTTTTFYDVKSFDLAAIPEKDRERVAALIPDRKYADAYTHRTIKGHTDFAVFASAHRLRHNILLPGPSGAGKTTAMRAYAAAHGLPFVSIEFSGGMDPKATFGSVTISLEDDGLPAWLAGLITLVVMYGGIVMLDEVNFAPPRFTAAFHGVLDVRQSLYLADIGDTVKKHEDCLIAAAYNPGYIGTAKLNEAFTNRYAFTIPWGYDAGVEDARIGVYSPTLLALVRNLRAEDAIRQDIGTNMMEEFIDVAFDMDADLAAFLFCSKLDGMAAEIATAAFEAQLPTIIAELEAVA